ncbi:MAG: carbohydrate ABC transporter permease [Spirochaetales bacterium]
MARSLEDRLFDSANTLGLILLAFVTLYPFWYILVISFNSAVDTVRGGYLIWPRDFTLYNYQVLLRDNSIFRAAFVSIARTVIGTGISVFSTAMLAYTLSRREYVFRRPITLIFVLTMYFNGGLIPTYFLIRGVGLLNSFFVYIIPQLVVAFNVIVMRTNMEALPESLVESARIEGANDFVIFARIILPLSMPVVATIALFVGVAQWNSWFDTFLYAPRRPELFTLQYELMRILQSTMSTQTMQSAEAMMERFDREQVAQIVTPKAIRASMTILATAPIIFVYPFLQRYFVKGFLVGGIKE